MEVAGRFHPRLVFRCRHPRRRWRNVTLEKTPRAPGAQDKTSEEDPQVRACASPDLQTPLKLYTFRPKLIKLAQDLASRIPTLWAKSPAAGRIRPELAERAREVGATTRDWPKSPRNDQSRAKSAPSKLRDLKFNRRQHPAPSKRSDAQCSPTRNMPPASTTKSVRHPLEQLTNRTRSAFGAVHMTARTSAK